jgi:putative NIF3 family GTP cyclohydrolase 1 type 2
VDGTGTFRGNEQTHPFVGEPGKPHTEKEIRLETVYPVWLENRIIRALLDAHPYEEVAFDIYPLENRPGNSGSGMVGNLKVPVDENSFLESLKEIFNVPVVRHSPLRGQPVSRVALCGGAGSFLLKDAIASGADIFLSGDFKYHQFFEPAGKIVIADIGHYESEQFTTELFYELLIKKFPTFALHLSEVNTNPVSYYI